MIQDSLHNDIAAGKTISFATSTTNLNAKKANILRQLFQFFVCNNRVTTGKQKGK